MTEFNVTAAGEFGEVGVSGAPKFVDRDGCVVIVAVGELFIPFSKDQEHRKRGLPVACFCEWCPSDCMCLPTFVEVYDF